MTYAETVKELESILGMTQEDDGCFHAEFQAEGYANDGDVVVVFVFFRQTAGNICSFEVATLAPKGIPKLTAVQALHLTSLFAQASHLAVRLEGVTMGRCWSVNEVTHYDEEQRQKKLVTKKRKSRQNSSSPLSKGLDILLEGTEYAASKKES